MSESHARIHRRRVMSRDASLAGVHPMIVLAWLRVAGFAAIGLLLIYESSALASVAPLPGGLMLWVAAPVLIMMSAPVVIARYYGEPSSDPQSSPALKLVFTGFIFLLAWQEVGFPNFLLTVGLPILYLAIVVLLTLSAIRLTRAGLL